MSFSANQFVGKLNTLEDSQESISSASKWLLSQYREADHVAETWKDYMLKKSLNVRRKLLGIYLLNHVVQQAKSQKMDHFHKAFSKVVPEVLTETYPQFPLDLQKKVKRVTDIWYDRGIFHKSILIEIRSIIKKINESGVHGEGVSSSSTSSSSTSSKRRNGSSSSTSAALELLPPNLQKYVSLQKELKKLYQSSKSLKDRFEKSAAELDPSSHVYEENYNTVAKIAKLATDTTTQEISHREQIIALLEEILHTEKKHLEQSQTTLTEIEFTLLSKDPSKALNASTDNDALPTYTADGNENDSDSDNDGSSSNSDSDEDNHSQTKNREVNTNLNSEIPLKRPSEENAMDSPEKKQRTDDHNNAEGDDENTEYDPFSSHINNDASNQEAENELSEPITSNIQDLLSKLAN